ncbi:WD40 repeat domain-containing protein [Mycobacterium angelicum]|uniref:WD40 repeat domain-containing protein n=1 Tax=Mycobacterium angelicum TaxID=470074 RepID=UPI0021F2FC68|nr:hypothetical protein [Mycobacterium angelicum]MCV7196568.1 hypothetical protein [Mycobacterium angelicum]
MLIGDNNWNMPTDAIHNANVIALSADGRLALTGHNDATLWLWDVPTASCLRIITGQCGPVGRVAIGGNGALAVSSGADDSRVACRP